MGALALRRYARHHRAALRGREQREGEGPVAEAFDLVVVGSGIGGLTAGITAKLAGLRPLVLEKTPLIGGSSAWSGGVLWLPNNPLMQREGIADSRDAGLRYLENFVTAQDGYSSPVRREAFLDNIAPMVAAMEAQGMKYRRCRGYSDYYDLLPGGNAAGRALEAELFDTARLGDWKAKFRGPSVSLPIRTSEGARLMRFGVAMDGKTMAAKVAARALGAKLSGKTIVGSGGALQGRMLEIALRLGVEIWTEAGLVDLDVANGRVEGVHLQRQGAPVSVRARRGVLVAAGGFAHNLQMRQAYQQAPVSDAWTSSNPGDAGEALQAMMRAGADTAVMDQAWWTSSWIREGEPVWQIIPELAKPHAILVDKAGRRLVNEANSYMEVGRAMYERDKTTPAIPAWVIMDAAHRRRYFFGFQPPGRMPRKWLEKGWVRQDATLEGLAQQCGIDPAGLRETVQRFNGFAQTGVDEDFGRGQSAYNRYYADPTNRPNPSLGPIAEPPFWAAPLHPGDVGTCGGVVADEGARVLRADGSVIEGLYATGNCTASLAGPHYVGAGQSIGASAVFGFIAARRAAQ
jgi:3-oxosteroid 1-dehydrogenase